MSERPGFNNQLVRTRTLTITTRKNLKDESGGFYSNKTVAQYLATITIDVDEILRTLATKAAGSKGKRAQMLRGKIKVQVSDL